MIDIKPESWHSVRYEIGPLWQEHYAEIGEDRDRVCLDPDWSKYDRLYDGGHLQIVSARRDGRLVGYAFTIVDYHLHYRTTLFAAYDLYWLQPSCRGGRTAVRLFHGMEALLKRCGVVKIVSNTKLAHDQGRLFEAMGFREAERIYVKVL